MMIHRRSRPTVEERSKKATPNAVGVAHYAPLGAAGIMALIGPFCKPHVQRGVMISKKGKKGLHSLLSCVILLKSPNGKATGYSSLAQSVEHAAVNRRVVGSSPTGGARKKRIG